MEMRDAYDWAKTAVDLPEMFDNAGLGTANHRGNRRCPVRDHNDSDPSCSVRQYDGVWIWNCFTCDKSGTAIDFVMEQDGIIDSVEAVRSLAAKHSIEITEREETGELPLVIAAARENLHFAEKYLASRGVDMALAKQRKMGVMTPVPGITDRAPWLYEQETPQSPADKERQWHRRWGGRLMIPHFNAAGKPVGLVARDMSGDRKPKYLYVAKFNKAERFYGIERVRPRTKTIGMVEGQSDAITTTEVLGAPVVAWCGATVSEMQISQIPSGTNLVLIPDNDLKDDGSNPGLASAMKAAGILTYERFACLFTLRIAVPPSGMDPDEWARTSPEEMKQAVADAPTWFDWRVAQIGDETTAEDVNMLRLSVSRTLPPQMHAAAEHKLDGLVGRQTTPIERARPHRLHVDGDDLPLPVKVYLGSVPVEHWDADLLLRAGCETPVPVGLDQAWLGAPTEATRGLGAFVATIEGAPANVVEDIRSGARQTV